MKSNLKEEQKMEMFIGVILPIILIVVANKLQASYKSRQEEKFYWANVDRMAVDIVKRIKELSAPESKV